MRKAVGYQLRTVALAFLGVPFVCSLALVMGVVATDIALSALGVDGPSWLGAVLVLVLALVGVFVLWFRWGRVRVRPAPAWATLVPVVAVPTYFLAVWVVCFALAPTAPQRAVAAFAGPALPWFVLPVWADLMGSYVQVPIATAAVLLVSVGGFVLGYRPRKAAPQNPGWASRAARTALAGALAVSVALVGVATYQVVSYERYASTPTVSAEVNLAEYQPFAPGNRLAVPKTPPTLRIDANHPRLDGATALAPVYAAVTQAVYVLPPSDREALLIDDTSVVACNGTGGAYDELIAGQRDAIFVAQPSQGQLAKAKAAGVDLKLTPIGREAFVFFVNADNPVTGLTLQQIRDIYTKKITNWNQVGGRNEDIVAYQRPEDSGSQTAMLAQVMRDTPMAAPMREEIAEGMGMVIDQVATYRNLSSALGYSFRWYATVMDANPQIKLLAVDGVEPTADNIRNGSYPLIGDFYVVTAGEPNANTGKLIEWLVSPQGQALIEQVGYVGR